MALSAAPTRAKAGEPHSAGPGTGGAALRRLGTAERAVWPVGSAGTAVPLRLDFRPRAHFEQTHKGLSRCSDP
eukprot:14544535-Alexandrium_andersonii.AAC.1